MQKKRGKLSLTTQPFVVIIGATKQHERSNSMQEKKTERAPGSYEDFVAYLGTCLLYTSDAADE